MIVCSCYGVSCRRIREEVDNGARTVKQVGLGCRAGRGCGACRVQISELIIDHRSRYEVAASGGAASACAKSAAGDTSAAA